MKEVFFVCPRCKTGLERHGPDCLRCPKDDLEFTRVDGIWRFLLPESEAHYRRFVSDYQTIRELEKRGSSDPAYYRTLPFKDLSERFSADWAIRARSYQALLSRVIHARLLRNPHPLSIVDLGAGNCWLSNQLAAEGHQIIAVDLLINDQDGLGVWKHYDNVFTPIQTEFNNLPLMDQFASVVVFNSSFHYSENYEITLKEALRLLLPKGCIVIMDSPVYHGQAAGEKMVEERRADFLARYGFTSDSLQSENFLTYARIVELGNSLGIRWQHIRPFYRLRWMLRPWLARIRGAREPAEFGLWVGAPV